MTKNKLQNPGTKTFAATLQKISGPVVVKVALLSFILLVGLSGNLLWAFDPKIIPAPIDRDPIGKRTPLILIHGTQYANVFCILSWCPGSSNQSYQNVWDGFLNFWANDQNLQDNFKPYFFVYETIEDYLDPGGPDNVFELGGALRDQMQVWYDNTGPAGFQNRPVVIMAHSLGGLIARSFMQQHWFLNGPQGGEKVLRLITFSTPHHGTPLADFSSVAFSSQLFSGIVNGIIEDQGWDAYDGVSNFGINNWLRCINNYSLIGRFPTNSCADPSEVSRNGFYGKIVAYGGSTNITLTNLWIITAGLLEAVGFPAHDNIVPIESTLFDNWPVLSRRRVERPCDHFEVPQGSCIIGGRFVFDLLRDDLLAALPVKWVTPFPPSTVSNQSYSATWNVTWGSSVTHTNIHWDIDDPADSSKCNASTIPQCSTASPVSTTNPGSAGNFSSNVPAPLTTSSTTYKFVAHAIVDGVQLWSSFISSAVSPPVNPVISVTPSSLDFGNTIVGNTKTDVFTVKNVGGGTLKGNVSAPAPFSIVSGSSYNLTSGQSRDVTVGFSPSSNTQFAANVSFTGGGGTSKLVKGKGVLSDTTAPQVILGKPNGGENWPAGSVQTITWNAVDDIAITSISLSYSIDGGVNWTTITNGLANTGSYSWSVPNTPSTTARVRVVAFDGTGASGQDSSDGNFTISSVCNVPAAPILNSIAVTQGSYTVAWNAVGGANSYILEEDGNSSFTNPLLYSVSSSTLSRFFSGKSSGTYYYRVKAVNSCGQGLFSGIQSATVILNQAPGPITAVSPADDATNQPLSVNLCWSASHPGGEALQFNVYVVGADTEFFFPNNIKSSGQTGTCYTASNLPYNTRFSWGIEAIDGTGDVRFSPMFHFNTIADTGAPTGAILINNGAATTDSYTVTLNLSASDAASGVQHMRFSNDGNSWSYWQNFAVQYPWNLADWNYGGQFGLTTYIVYAQFRDQQGNVSDPPVTDSITKVAGTPGIIILKEKFYQTVQDAINDASSGDTVYLTEGVFNVTGAASALRPHDPNRNVGIVMRPGVSLKGAGANKTTINFQNSFFAIVDSDNALLEGIKISNASFPSSTTASVLIESNGSKIKNNTITGSHYGIQVGYNSEHPGSNLEVSNNLITGNSEGMRIFDGSNISVVNNTVVNNAPNCGVCTYVASTTITNNIVSNNGFGLGAFGVTPTIRFNDVFNAGGNYSDIPNQTGLNGNISADPQFVNAAGGDYRLNSGSPAINTGTDVGIPFAGSAPDMGAFEFNATGTIQVTSNQPGASFTVVGPQATYNGSGTNWSVPNVPIGVYTITFAPIPNLYSPPYQAKTLLSGQTLSFDGTYAQDLIPPTGTMTVNYGEYATGNSLVALTFDLTDDVAGLGAGSSMKFSNDGVNWSPVEPYSTVKKNWDLTSFGGSAAAGLTTVYSQVSDSLGNWTTFADTILYVPNRQILEVPSEYGTIQSAIDVAQPGDIVHVAPGNYSEFLLLRDGVTVQGSGPDRTTFFNGGQGVPVITAAANSSIHGFGGVWRIVVLTGPVIIANNVYAAGSIFGGVAVGGPTQAVVRNNVFNGNNVGLDVDGPASVIAENNTFVNIIFAAQRIINATPATRLYNRNNIIAYNGIGVQEIPSSGSTHQHVFSSFNTYWSNTNNFSGPNLSMAGGDVQADPLFVNRAGADFHLSPGSSSIDSGHPEARYDDPDGSRNDRGAYGGPTLNTSPVADFTITPSVGNIGAFFTFDASSSFDKETSDSQLLVRWDFDSDGVWDTNFSPLKITSEQFTALGTFNVVLEVRDEKGFLATATRQVTINNQGPNIPTNPSPGDGSSNQPIAISLSWSGGDPDPTDTITYDVHFGTTTNPPLVSTDQPIATYLPASTNHHTFYYWRVVAKDNHGNSTSGPVWSFLTAPADSTPPDTSITGGPTGTIKVNSASFTWTGSDDVSQAGNLGYSYRLDPLEPNFSTFGNATTINYSQLANGAYTFYVKARDEAGNEDPSPASRSFTVNVVPPPQIGLTVPNGGETWQIGSTQNIQWSSNFPGKVKVLISRNGGAKWTLIFASKPNDGNQPWKVKGATTTALIKVCRVKAPSVCDISDANFSIQP